MGVFDDLIPGGNAPQAGAFDDLIPQKKQNKGLAGDIGTDLKRGIMGIPGAVTGLVDIPVAAATGEAAIGKGWDRIGKATGFQPSKWAKEAEAEYSPARQEANQKTNEAWDNGTAMDIAGSYLSNPGHKILGPIVESAPSMIAGGVAARGIATAAKIAPAIAGGIGEGTIMAGQAMNNLIGEGVDARTAAGYSAATGIAGGAIGAVGGKVAQKLGVIDPDTALAGGAARAASEATGIAAAKETGKRMIGGGISEGAFEELPQSVMEQGFSNLAQGSPVTEGMARAGVEGTLAGFGMGAAFNALPGSKYAESKRTPPAEDKQEISGLLPAPTMNGTPGDQTLQAEVDRQNAVDAAQKNADQLYAERAAYEEALKALYPSGLPTLTTDPAPLQQRIDEMLGIDSNSLKGLRKVQYQKQLEAAFKEVVGITHDADGREIPLTMGALLDSQATAEAEGKRIIATRNAEQQAGARAQQLADEETQPAIPVVGPLSAIANAAVKSGVAAHVQMQQAAAAQAKAKPEAGPLSKIAAQPEQANGPIATQAAAQVATPGAEIAGGDVPGSAGVPSSAFAGDQGRGGNSAEVAAPGMRPAVSAGIAGGQSAAVDQITGGQSDASQFAQVAQAPAQTNDAPAGQTSAAPAARQGQGTGVAGSAQAIDLSNRTDAQLNFLSQRGINGNKEAAITEIARRAAASGANEQQAEAGLPASTAGVSRPAPVDYEAQAMALAREIMGNKFEATHKEINAFLSEARARKIPHESTYFGDDPAWRKSAVDIVAEENLRNSPTDKIKARINRIIGSVDQSLDRDVAKSIAQESFGGRGAAGRSRDRARGSEAREIQRGQAGRLQEELKRRELVSAQPAPVDAASQPKTDAAPEAKQDKAPVSADQYSDENRRALYLDMKDKLMRGEITLQEGQRAMAKFDEDAEAAKEAASGKPAEKKDEAKPADLPKNPQNLSTLPEPVKETAKNEQVPAVDAKKQEETKPAEDGNPANKAEAKKSASADAGEELTYNKRNRLKRGIQWSDVADKNATLQAKEVVKAKVYPKPDYAALVDGGMSPVIAHIIKQVYDGIASSPKMGRGEVLSESSMKAYIDGVNRVMEGVMQWANDPQMVGSWASRQSKLAGGSFSVMDTFSKNDAPKDVVYPNGYKEFAAEVYYLGGNKFYGSLQPGYDEVNRAMKDIKLGWPSKVESWQKQGYKIIEATGMKSEARAFARAGREPFIYVDLKKVGGNTVIANFQIAGATDVNSADVQQRIGEEVQKYNNKFVLQDKSSRVVGVFDTQEAAEEGARNAVKKEKDEGAIKEIGRAAAEAERIGAERRMEGQDVSSDDLVATFGFRGVNFGNSMQGDSKPLVKERQLHLNHIHDAFMDLAELLNVPPKALSLNGMLGIAVGAQGSGKALAHFVPGVNEINITRRAGAGALAHEWGHAFDHYFAAMGGLGTRKGPYLTEHVGIPRKETVQIDGKWVTREVGMSENLRPEIADQFRSIVQAMTKRQESAEDYKERLTEQKQAAQKNTEGWLRAVRREFTKAAQATGKSGEDVLNQLGLLEQQITNLDLGDGKVAVSPKLSVSPAVHEIGTLYANAFGKRIDQDNLAGVQYYVDRMALMRDMMNSTEEREARTIDSRYLSSSKAADGKKRDYWATKSEMFARALDAYVVDSLAEKESKNQYLAGIEAVPPMGDERKSINRAFDFLIAELKTKETDSGVMLYNQSSAGKISPADKAIYGMAAEGKSAAEILKFIASASRSPFNRQVAKLLLKTGIQTTVTVGDGKNWKMNAGDGHKYAAGYNPKTDVFALFRPASAERHTVHELVHAASVKALSGKGLAAMQMKALFAHVQKNGKSVGLFYDQKTKRGIYGMANIDEFIAEAFSNPKFQAMLKKVPAPQRSGSLSSAWSWFVRIIRGILGVQSNQENALAQALEIGVDVMRENMKAGEADGDTRYATGPKQADTEAFRKWSKGIPLSNMTDIFETGKPTLVRVLHGSPVAKKLNIFQSSYLDSGQYSGAANNTLGWYFTSSPHVAASYAMGVGVDDDYIPPATFKAMQKIMDGGFTSKGAGATDAFVRLDNPLVVPMDEFSNLIEGSHQSNATFSRYLKDYGYDGVIVTMDHSSGSVRKSEFIRIAKERNDSFIRVVERQQESKRYRYEKAAEEFYNWLYSFDDDGSPAPKEFIYLMSQGLGGDVFDKARYVDEKRFADENNLSDKYPNIPLGVSMSSGGNIWVVVTPEASDKGQIKSAIGNSGDFDATNPDIRYNVAEDGWSVSEPSKMDDLIYAMQDKQVDMKRVMQSIMQTGKKVKDEVNAYLQEELFHGRAAKGVKDFLDFELRPLLKEMQQGNIDMGDFEEYLWNAHAQERNEQIARVNPEMKDGGSGIKTADAKAYLAALSPELRGKFQSLAARVNAINNASQQALVESGLEKQETIDAWNGAYRHYVPLQREDVDSGHMGTGKGFSIRGSSTKRALGSGRKVVDIIANLTMQRERNIVRAEKNRVSLAVRGLAMDNPNADFWTVDEAPKERVIENKAIYTVMDGEGRPNEFTRMADAEKFARSIPGANIEQTWQDRVTERVVPGFSSRDNVLLARVNGEDKYVIFNERDARALRMVSSLKNLDMDNMGRVLSLVGKATRYLSAINTQYNPVFGVINLIRDTQGALVNLSSTPLAGEQKKVLGYTTGALIGIYKDIRAHRQGKVPSSEWAALFEEFQKEGGQTGYRDQYANAEARAESIISELKQIKEGKPKQMLRGVFGWLSDYNDTMENSVRLAAYRAAKEKGMSKQQAASLAKNLTVNFNRKGQVATQVGALYAFFNASMQGSARLAQTLFEANDGDIKSVRLSKTGKKILAGGIMLGSMQALLLAAAGFGDDEPPEFIRERNLIMPIGDGKYLTLAMPLGLHVIPGIGRIATEFVMGGGKDPLKHMAAFAGMFAESFNPIGSAGFSLQTIAPSVIDPFAALAENRDFTGKEIYRENRNAMSPTPGHARAKDVATFYSRWISEGLNFITGGTEFKPGMLSWSPDSIDYLVGQVTGGVGREANKVFQTGRATMTGEDLPLYKIPLVGRFVGDTSGQSGESAKFYDAIKQINMHENQMKGLREERRFDEAREYAQENPAVRLIMAGNHAERTIQKLRYLKRDMIKSDADQSRVKEIDERITASMKSFNERAATVF
jgi:hypothetical protein